MTLNDLKVDIITSISSLSDLSLLKEVKRTLNLGKVSINNTNSSVWNDAEIEIREGVSFEQLMKEQSYRRISFSEFTSNEINEEWEVSLDLLLSNSN